MISSTTTYNNSHTTLEHLTNNTKTLIDVVGIVLSSKKEYSGDIHNIPYGEYVLVRDGKNKYILRKRTDGTIEVSK